MKLPFDVVGFEAHNGDIFCPKHRQPNARIIRALDQDFDRQPQCVVCLKKILVWTPTKAAYGRRYITVPAAIRINP